MQQKPGAIIARLAAERLKELERRREQEISLLTDEELEARWLELRKALGIVGDE